jgi:hypothetical protein
VIKYGIALAIVVRKRTNWRQSLSDDKRQINTRRHHRLLKTNDDRDNHQINENNCQRRSWMRGNSKHFEPLIKIE